MSICLQHSLGNTDLCQLVQNSELLLSKPSSIELQSICHNELIAADQKIQICFAFEIENAFIAIKTTKLTLIQSER